MSPPVAQTPEATLRGRRGWRVRGEVLALDPPLVMGILNLTPDSFSDGGELPDVPAALRRAERMVEEGAALLDLGGESTRPGARPVDLQEELRRVLPVVEALAGRGSVPISVDTRKAEVARAALRAGASIVNDVSALSYDPAMADVVAGSGAGVVLMHSRGTPADMHERAAYGNVEEEVLEELGAALERAGAAGIPRECIVLDPGLGFAKTAAQNLRLLGRLERLAASGLPLMLGPSRKRFLGELLGAPLDRRATGTAAVCVMAYLAGGRIFRVHDVAQTVDALIMARAIEREKPRAGEAMVSTTVDGDPRTLQPGE